MQKFSVKYNKMNEWRLFINCPKRSLQAVLENIELVLTKIGYTAHDWMIFGDVTCVNGIIQQEVNTGSKTLVTKDISLTWEQEHFAQKSCRSKENTAAAPSY
jgi:hypothetical protein